MFLYIKTNILRGYGIFKNDFAHPREPASLRCESASRAFNQAKALIVKTDESFAALHGPCELRGGWRDLMKSVEEENKHKLL